MTNTQEEIIEGNKLITEFMGLKWLGETHVNDKHTYMGIEDGPFEAEADYHSSWDWLMPVVEKISQLCKRFTVMMDEDGCYISVNAEGYYQSGRNKDFIRQYYIAVVEFIKWYNTQNQKQS